MNSYQVGYIYRLHIKLKFYTIFVKNNIEKVIKDIPIEKYEIKLLLFYNLFFLYLF